MEVVEDATETESEEGMDTEPGEICKHLAGAYNSNSHARGLHYLTFVCGKQLRSNQRNGVSHFKEKCLRKAQQYQSSLKEEKALAN
jgi:hypothetical protein